MTGDCSVCDRENVEVVQKSYGYKRRGWLACADEDACWEAFQIVDREWMAERARQTAAGFARRTEQWLAKQRMSS